TAVAVGGTSVSCISEQLDEMIALSAQFAKQRSEPDAAAEQCGEEQVVREGRGDGDAVVEFNHSRAEATNAGRRAESVAGGRKPRDPGGDRLLVARPAKVLDDQAVAAQKNQMLD